MKVRILVAHKVMRLAVSECGWAGGPPECAMRQVGGEPWEFSGAGGGHSAFGKASGHG